jgi:3-hydroxyisobutyrate dehydrogenase-like beta-hydroxyacid dehydrogenase
MSDQPHHIAMIGVGRMGGPMARNLRKAGFEVVAYDVSAAAREALAHDGITPAASPAEALAGAEVALLSLPSDEALQSLASAPDGLLASVRAGQIVLDMSTSRVDTSRQLAARLAERGAALLDAPVSGGEQGARDGTLSIMVGGDKAVFERVQPVLAALGTTITYIGGNGMGLVAKLVNQMLMEATFCAVGEALHFAQVAGADLDAVYQAVRGGHGRSAVLDMMYEQVRAGDFGSGRELTLHTTDGGYALDAARALGVWTPMTEVSHDLFERAYNAGLGMHSAAAVLRLLEQDQGAKHSP